MISLVMETCVTKEWLSESEVLNFIAICESTPGPIAINMATFVGSSQGGILGSICATLGVVLPSFIIIVLIASILKKFIKNKYFQAFLDGVKPVVIGLILSTGMMLIIKCIGFNSVSSFVFDYKSLIVFITIGLIFYLTKILFKKKINTIILIIISAGLGILVSLI